MAENKGLTREELAKARAWFERTGVSAKLRCVACDSQQWIPGEHLVQPVTLDDNRGLMLGGISYPQFMLTCSNCAHTEFFNAVIMGLVPSARQQAENDVAPTVPATGGQP